MPFWSSGQEKVLAEKFSHQTKVKNSSLNNGVSIIHKSCLSNKGKNKKLTFLLKIYGSLNNIPTGEEA
jgi:hypothetical protein